jgi:isopentenyl diphosphate isomerase/L-lactate dehydrogenase-like FMN-dependent dehydrogenase
MHEAPRFVTVDDYEPSARAALPGDIYDYIAGGAGDEWTLGENRRAFDRWILRPRFLRGSGAPDISTTVLGQRVSMPVLVAPWAFQRLVHPDGERATARAAAAAGSIVVVSSTALDYLEEVATGSLGPKWWQLYVFTDRAATADMLRRVAAAGYGAICLTVDFQAVGLRHRDERSGFVLPIGPLASDLAFDPMLSWDDLPWIREQAPGLPLLLKGILTSEDARLAVEAGADGIVVSNHGGRQLDGAPAGITALPEVVEAVAGRIPVLVDGGIRRGTDILKALALGAAAVMVGRPAAWGLATAGEEGVAGVLRILRDEFENAMALSGCLTVAEITRALVAPSPGA